MNALKLTDNITQEIALLAEQYIQQNDFNKIIRDEVFSYLENECIVLYYPLPNEDINGFHVKKCINGCCKEFVFINTANPVEKQIFAAAHEFGHLWHVPEKISEKFSELELTHDLREQIVNRFAAELLMPKKIFIEQLSKKLKEFKFDGHNIPALDLIKVVVYLMNFFFVPYKSIIIRLNELSFLSDEVTGLLISREEGDEDFKGIILASINEGQYTRLNKPTNSSTIEKLGELIKKAEKDQLLSSEKLQLIKNDFNIKDDDLVIPFTDSVALEAGL